MKNIKHISGNEKFLFLNRVTRIPDIRYPAILSDISEETKRNCNQVLFSNNIVKIIIMNAL
jgi:hypothetical protein